MDRESLMKNAIQGSQGTSLVAQWLRFRASKAEGVCPIPAQGTKIPHATGMAKKVGGKKGSWGPKRIQRKPDIWK